MMHLLCLDLDEMREILKNDDVKIKNFSLSIKFGKKVYMFILKFISKK
jgi:hypothetical protein